MRLRGIDELQSKTSFKGVYYTTVGAINGDTRSLDYGSDGSWKFWEGPSSVTVRKED